MKLKCGSCQQVSEAIEISTYARYQCSKCQQINEVANVELNEWLGFNYQKFIDFIEQYINQDEFEALRAADQLEASAGKFTAAEINKLKDILKVSFNEGLSIRDISNKIKKEIDVKNLYEVSDGEVTDKVLAYAARRPLLIARTESTRVAAEGTLLNYKQSDVKEVAWLSSTGARTCDICNANNGQIMNITEANNKIPAHPNCRCTFIPVIKEAVKNG